MKSDRNHWLITCVGWATACLLLVTLFCGCAGLRSRGPVDRNVLVARQLSQRGMDALDQGRVREAEAHFSDALNQCPANVNARCRLADCLWRRGASYDAIEQLSEALAMSDHDDTQMLVRLGQMKLDVGDVEQAQQLVNKALQASADDPSAWRLDGSIKHRKGAWIDALASYQRALSYGAQDFDTQMAVAEIYHELERPGRTLATLKRLKGSVVPAARSQRMSTLEGIALHRLKRHEEATDALAAAIEAGEPSIELLAQLAEAQLAAGQYQQARQTIRNALPLAGSEQHQSLQRLMTQIAAHETAHEISVR